MKFKVESKEKGYSYKKAILKELEDALWVTVEDVCNIVPDAKSLDDNNKHIGWNEEADLKKKIRVRQTKDGWWLYLPDPNYDDLEDRLSDESLLDQIMILMTESVYGIPCRVISKPKKNVVREEFGYSYGGFQLKFTKSNGEEIAYPVFLVRMIDGTARQVKPENIIFGWEDE